MIPLDNDLRKGDSGRIGVVGGSFEYTGAPYFAAMAALRMGADLAFILCDPDAAAPIKSYAPEIIVHPILPRKKEDDLDLEHATRLIKSLHVLIIGPGLGRNPITQSAAKFCLECAQRLGIPCVIDGDGINLLSSYEDKLAAAIITPNHREFRRLCGYKGIDPDTVDAALEALGSVLGNVLLLLKDKEDAIVYGKIVERNRSPGAPRRCGGQGDILAGVVATMWHHLRFQSPSHQPAALVEIAYHASGLIRKASLGAFHEKGRAMITSDILTELCRLNKE